MSDATLPPPRSSSISDSQSEDFHCTPSSENDVPPFAVHSQDGGANLNASEVENGRLARQKRRRTSPEDQATLEAEYRRNPKPDKAARMEIVKHVALGEKEVQIWFQNRRQNTRRKSRPLLPHEIAAFGVGGLASLSSDPLSNNGFSCGRRDQELHSSQLEIPIGEESQVNGMLFGELDTSNSMSASKNVIQGKTTMSTTPPNLPGGSESSRSLNFSSSQAASQPAVLGYLSNRRNAPNSSVSAMASPMSATPTLSNYSSSLPSSFPERVTIGEAVTPSLSQIRLSMSLDGKAELVPTDPSPKKGLRPRTSSCSTIPEQRHGSLQRSQSALSIGHIPRKASFSAPFVPRMPLGRSRDARTWEFCCDTDARDELTTQAENESSGSAVAAISLLRSTNISALKSNVNKRNAPAPKIDTSHGKKPKLARAYSSVARMQGSKEQNFRHSSKGEGSMTRSPSGDSDKENWAPDGGNGSTQPRRPLPSGSVAGQSRRRVLGPSRTSSVDLAVDRPRSKHKLFGTTHGQIFEDDVHNEVDAEVEKFMRGEVSPSKKGDLDCIQGLLSLSQGNWR